MFLFLSKKSIFRQNASFCLYFHIDVVSIIILKSFNIIYTKSISLIHTRRCFERRYRCDSVFLTDLL